MVTLTNENFKSEILDHKGVAVVLFTAPWDTTAVEAEEYFKTRLGIKFGTVDFDEERDLVHKYSVRQLPLFLLFRDGKLFQIGDSLKSFLQNCGI